MLFHRHKLVSIDNKQDSIPSNKRTQANENLEVLPRVELLIDSGRYQSERQDESTRAADTLVCKSQHARAKKQSEAQDSYSKLKRENQKLKLNLRRSNNHFNQKPHLIIQLIVLMIFILCLSFSRDSTCSNQKTQDAVPMSITTSTIASTTSHKPTSISKQNLLHYDLQRISNDRQPRHNQYDEQAGSKSNPRALDFDINPISHLSRANTFKTTTNLPSAGFSDYDSYMPNEDESESEVSKYIASTISNNQANGSSINPNAIQENGTSLISDADNSSPTFVVSLFSHIDKQWKFAEVIVIIVVSFILNLVTIIGNIMVLISFKMDRSLQTVSNYFLLSLALADLLIGLISMPLYTLYLLLNYWPLGPLMCDIWLAIDYLNSNAAVLNMLIISFDRYFSVTRPLTYRAKRTTKHACLMISCAWILSLTIWTPAIFTYPYYKGRTVQGTDKCEIEFVKANTYLTFVTAILAFYIPVIIMIYLYWRIWLETKKRYRDLTTLFLVSGVGAAAPARITRPQMHPAATAATSSSNKPPQTSGSVSFINSAAAAANQNRRTSVVSSRKSPPIPGKNLFNQAGPIPVLLEAPPGAEPIDHKQESLSGKSNKNLNVNYSTRQLSATPSNSECNSINLDNSNNENDNQFEQKKDETFLIEDGQQRCKCSCCPKNGNAKNGRMLKRSPSGKMVCNQVGKCTKPACLNLRMLQSECSKCQAKMNQATCKLCSTSILPGCQCSGSNQSGKCYLIRSKKVKSHQGEGNEHSGNKMDEQMKRKHHHHHRTNGANSRHHHHHHHHPHHHHHHHHHNHNHNHHHAKSSSAKLSHVCPHNCCQRQKSSNHCNKEQQLIGSKAAQFKNELLNGYLDKQQTKISLITSSYQLLSSNTKSLSCASILRKVHPTNNSINQANLIDATENSNSPSLDQLAKDRNNNSAQYASVSCFSLPIKPTCDEQRFEPNEKCNNIQTVDMATSPIQFPASPLSLDSLSRPTQDDYEDEDRDVETRIVSSGDRFRFESEGRESEKFKSPGLRKNSSRQAKKSCKHFHWQPVACFEQQAEKVRRSNCCSEALIVHDTDCRICNTRNNTCHNYPPPECKQCLVLNTSESEKQMKLTSEEKQQSSSNSETNEYSKRTTDQGRLPILGALQSTRELNDLSEPQATLQSSSVSRLEASNASCSKEKRKKVKKFSQKLTFSDILVDVQESQHQKQSNSMLKKETGRLNIDYKSTERNDQTTTEASRVEHFLSQLSALFRFLICINWFHRKSSNESNREQATGRRQQYEEGGESECIQEQNNGTSSFIKSLCCNLSGIQKSQNRKQSTNEPLSNKNSSSEDSETGGNNNNNNTYTSATKPSYSSHHPIQPKSERKAAKTLSTLLLVFIVTWLPYNILVLIKTLSGGEDQVPEKIWNFSYYLCYINSTINPLCYALCNAQFRRTYMRILKCKLSNEHNSTRRLVPIQSSTTWNKDLRFTTSDTTTPQTSTNNGYNSRQHQRG